MLQLSIFDLPHSEYPSDTKIKLIGIFQQLLNEYKFPEPEEIDTRIIDYCISSAVSNEYMPIETARMHVYVMMPNHTASLQVTNKKGREHPDHCSWRHSALNMLSHEDREIPKYHLYSLEKHLYQHFNYIEIDGLNINTMGNPYELREFIAKHDW